MSSTRNRGHIHLSNPRVEVLLDGSFNSPEINFSTVNRVVDKVYCLAWMEPQGVDVSL